MAGVEYVRNRKGERDLLKLPGVAADLKRRATKVDAAATGMSRSGESTYEVRSEIGRVRARAAVITDSPAAAVAEARWHRLARALGAAR